MWLEHTQSQGRLGLGIGEVPLDHTSLILRCVWKISCPLWGEEVEYICLHLIIDSFGGCFPVNLLLSL